MGTPYRVTLSWPWPRPAWSTSAARCSCASPGDRPAARPTPAGCGPRSRAHSRDVSTSSAAITQSGRLPGQAGAGEDGEPGAAGAEVLAAAAGAARMAPRCEQQAGQQRPGMAGQVAGRGAPRPFGERSTVTPRSPASLPQLGVDVLPLADAQVVEVLGAAQPAERAEDSSRWRSAGSPRGSGRPGSPRSGRRTGRGAGRRPRRVGGPLARVLDGQRRRDDQHLAEAAVPVGLEHHPAEARVDRQPGQLAAEAAVSRPSDRTPFEARARAAVSPSAMCARRAGRGTGRRRCRPGRARSSAG